MKLIAVIFFGLCAFVANAASLGYPTEQTEFIHAASKGDAAKMVDAWVNEDRANRTWSTAGYTGSMKPKIKGGEYLMLVPYVGQPIPRGKIIVFDRGDIHRVLHRMFLGGGKTGSFFAKGDNCSQPDGWFPRTAIKYVCEGVITFPAKSK